MDRSVLVAASLILTLLTYAACTRSVKEKFDVVDSVSMDTANTTKDTTNTSARVQDLTKKMLREIDSLKRLDSARRK